MIDEINMITKAAGFRTLVVPHGDMDDYFKELAGFLLEQEVKRQRSERNHMIKLNKPDTLGNCEPFWLNASLISSVQKLEPINAANNGATTRIWAQNISYDVAESVDIVISMIEGGAGKV